MLRPPTTLIKARLKSLVQALVVALVTVLVAGALTVASSASASARSAKADHFDTDLTLRIARCEGCVVTMFSNDGISPIYSSAPATVSGRSVTVTVPSARTAGLSIQIRPSWVSSSKPATNGVWRSSRTEIGDRVSFKTARSKRRDSGCWAGTVNEAVELTVKVRRVRHRGQRSAIAWAPVTQSYRQPMKRSRRGVLAPDDVLACNLSR